MQSIRVGGKMECLISPYWYSLHGSCIWGSGWVFASDPIEAAENAISDFRRSHPAATVSKVNLQRKLGGHSGPSDYFTVEKNRITYSTDGTIEVTQ